MLDNSQILRKTGKYTAICSCKQCSNEFVCNFYDARKSPIGHLCSTCKNLIIDLDNITQESLQKVLRYDRESGLVTHRYDSASGLAGTTVGYPHKEGYLSVSLGRKEYLLHRIIWVMETGETPNQVDHINHIRNDNRWSNLRNVTSRQNQMNMGLSSNTSSKVNGVRILPSGRFQAHITVNRKQIGLGTYDTLEEALLARKQADATYGFHVNHGR